MVLAELEVEIQVPPDMIIGGMHDGGAGVGVILPRAVDDVVVTPPVTVSGTHAPLT